MSDEALKAHLQRAVAQVPAFDVTLAGTTAHENEYLFLNVKRGNDVVIHLHDVLYSGALSGHLVRGHTFVPHITVGRVSPRELAEALDATRDLASPIEGRVDSISVYRIEQDGSRTDLFELPLGGRQDQTRLEHAELWVRDLEGMRSFYEQYFQMHSGPKYHNQAKRFTSYFLSFPGGGRLELMHRPDVLPNPGAFPGQDCLGFVRLGLEVETRSRVDTLTARLRDDGFPVLDGPRTTGDGYYESIVADPEGNRIVLTAAPT